MHRLTIPKNITEPIPLDNGKSLEPGKTYLVSNRFLGSVFGSPWRCKDINGVEWPIRMLAEARPWEQKPDLNAPHIWLYRGGGWGDLIMMTPAILAIQNKWPDKTIHVACGDKHHCLFDGIDNIVLERIPVEEHPDDYDGNRAIISFEEAMEGDPTSTNVHIAQVFAQQLGIILEDLVPVYHMTHEEKVQALRRFPRKFKKRVGIQLLASALYRSYPSMANVMVELAKQHEVFVFGQPGTVEFKSPIPGVTNMMDYDLSFRESAAVLATCDSCVAPDSAFVHLSAALDIPCVALYGPFPSSLRISSSKVNALEGTAPCAPCFFHADFQSQFPAGMPCSEEGKCVALAKIPVEAVVDAVNEQLDIPSNILVLPALP